MFADSRANHAQPEASARAIGYDRPVDFTVQDVDGKLAQTYRGKAAVFALDASAGETVDEVTEAAEKAHWTLPVLLNPDGSAADIFGTKLTTTTVVVDADGMLRYCGQFSHGDHKYAEHALDAVLHGKEVHTKTTPHHG